MTIRRQPCWPLCHDCILSPSTQHLNIAQWSSGYLGLSLVFLWTCLETVPLPSAYGQWLARSLFYGMGVSVVFCLRVTAEEATVLNQCLQVDWAEQQDQSLTPLSKTNVCNTHLRFKSSSQLTQSRWKVTRNVTAKFKSYLHDITRMLNNCDRHRKCWSCRQLDFLRFSWSFFSSSVLRASV